MSKYLEKTLWGEILNETGALETNFLTSLITTSICALSSLNLA
jgi:hypothetical protein